MGVSDEEVSILPHFRPKEHRLNGFGKHLDGVLEKLDLQSGMVVVDLPCGQGGVSVPLAERYGVTVAGYDLLPQYVDYANDFAAERGVETLCGFAIGDIRQIAEQGEDICDLLLWIAPPHLWGTARETIKALRRLVKSEGVIVIADAYRLTESGAVEGLERYEAITDTCSGYTSYDDEIVDLKDYGTSLWKEDYRYTRRTYLAALSRAKSQEEKKKIRRVIDDLPNQERLDREHLGCAVWTIRVQK